MGSPPDAEVFVPVLCVLYVVTVIAVSYLDIFPFTGHVNGAGLHGLTAAL